jgi:hypothetical protein
MTWNKFDHKLLGVVLGLLGPFLGFLLYGLYYSWEFNSTLSHFINNVFLGTKSYQSPIISLSLIADLGIFFLALKWKLNTTAKGVVYALLIYVPIVIYLRFF